MVYQLCSDVSVKIERKNTRCKQLKLAHTFEDRDSLD